MLILAEDGTVALVTDAATALLGLDAPPRTLPVNGVRPRDAAGTPIPLGLLPWNRALREHRTVVEDLRLAPAQDATPLRVTCTPLDGSDPVGVAVTLAPSAPGKRRVGLGELFARGEDLAAVLARMPAGITVIGSDGTILYANDEVGRIWREDVTAGVRVGVGRVGFYPDGRRYEPREWPAARALRGEVVRDEQIEIVRGDGTPGWLSVSAAPLKSPDGEVVASVGVVLDVTDRVLAERLTEALSGISEVAVSRPPVEELLAGVLARASDAMRADAAVFVEPAKGTWRVRAARGLPGVSSDWHVPRPAVELLIRMLRAGEAVAVDDVREAPLSRIVDPEAFGVRSVVGAPIVAQGRPVGFLFFGFRSPNESAGAYIGFAEKIARTVSLALESESLTLSLKQEVRWNRLLRMVAQTTTTTNDLGVACRRILKALNRELGMRSGLIFVGSEESAPLRLYATLGLSAEGEELTAGWEDAVDVDLPMIGDVYDTGRTLTHEDWESSEVTCALEKALDFEHGRFACVPVTFRKRTEGVLQVQFEGKRPFTAAEIELLEAVAHTVGQAIENSRLLIAEMRARETAAAELELSNVLLETSERLAAALELPEVLEVLVDSIVRVTGRENVVIALHDQREDAYVVQATRGPMTPRRGVRWAADDLPEAIRPSFESRRVQEIAIPIEAMKGGRAADLVERGTRGLFVPLTSQDRLIGMAMAADDTTAPATIREMRLLEGIAAQAAVVVQNASLYDVQHRIAETLQEAMLVMPEHVAGVRYGTLYRSATLAARVGGDFYDIFELGAGRVAFVVGDVSGKGVDAASVTALARTTFRIHAAEGYAPSDVMSRTNDVLCRFTTPSTFVTAFYGVLEVATGMLLYVVAGHPDGFIVGPNAYVRALAGQCPLLGAIEDAVYEERAAVLAPSDTLFLYTDGVTEARRGREFYGMYRLAEFLAASQDNDPRTLPAAVLRDVAAFSSGGLRDDIAMLAVGREPDLTT